MGKRRPNGDGTVRKRPDGRWEARIIVGHKENKKPIYKSVFGLTQAEAMAKFRKLQEVYRGVELTEDSIVTLNEWLDRWLACPPWHRCRFRQTPRPGAYSQTPFRSCDKGADSLSRR